MKTLVFILITCVMFSYNALNAQHIHKHESYLQKQIDCSKDRGTQAEQIAAIYLTKEAIIERLSKLSGDAPNLINNYIDHLMVLVKGAKAKFFREYISGNMTLEQVEELIHEKSLALLAKYLDLKSGKDIFNAASKQNVVTETENQIKGFIGTNRILNGPCVNPDMETCDFTDWDLTVGNVDGNPYGYINVQNTTCWATWPANNNCPGNSGYDQHHIVTGGNDQFGFPMVSPGGSCSAMLGDYTGMNYGAAAMRKTFLVAPGNAVLTLSYAAVLQDGGHTPGDQPFFRVRVYDQNNNSLSCGLVDVYANDGQPGWNTTGGVQWRPWTDLFIPLASYIGQNITIEFTVGDCNLGGHYGYAYVEASCNPMALLSGSDACSGTVNLQAPPGAASYLWNTGATTQSINVTQSGYYSVQVIPVTGPACAVTLDTNIVINPNPPTPNFVHNAPVCFGTPVSFQNTSVPAPGDPITQYSWNFGDGSPLSNQQNPQHTYTNPAGGNYNVTLTVTTQGGCVESITLPLSQPSQITTPTNSVTESCPGACNGQAIVAPQGGIQPYSYSWTTGGNPIGGNNPALTNLCAGNYSVTVTDNMGCQANANVQINPLAPININPGPNQTICIGQNANISVNGNGGVAPLSYIWSHGLPNATSHSVNPNITTVYSVYIQDATGCVSPTVQITVNVHPPLNVIALQNQSICNGQQANISAQASGGNGGPYTYTWTDGVNNFNGPNHIVSPTTTTIYTVTATDNCTTPAATAQVTITVNQNPVVSFVADNLQGCSPVSGIFTNNTDPNLTGTCFWDFGNGVTSNQCNPNYTYTQPGCYNITLTVTSAAGCVGTATQNQYICVWPNPLADFIPSPQPTNVLTPQIQFTNTSQGATIYAWDFAGLGNSNAVHPSFVFPNQDPGTYMVCLHVENQYGCVDDICKPVVIDDYFTIYVPNAFTPTGDGINDVFLPILDGIYPESYQFFIFNRWGELIFETNNPYKGWDGRYRGLMSQQDVYVWKIIVKDAVEHKKRTYYGHVTLLK